MSEAQAAIIREQLPRCKAQSAERIGKARGVSPDAVRKLIAAHTEGPALGFLGQAHVNVLLTNRALDATTPKGTAAAS